MKPKIRTFVIADPHFNDPKIVKLANRPFNNESLMQKKLISNWNSLVTEDDLVIILGDFILSYGGKSNFWRIIKHLNGRKILTCLTEDTKTYVKNKGFLYQHEIRVGDEVLGVKNKKNKKLFLQWHKIQAKQVYDYNGDIYYTDNPTIQMQVTPDHAMYLYPDNEKSNHLAYQRAESLYYHKNSTFKIPTNGWLEKSESYNVSNNIIKLLAWIVSEGTVNKYNQIQIYQNESKHFNVICDLLKVENIKYSVYNGKHQNHKVIYIAKRYCDDLLKCLPNGKLNIQFLIDNFSTKQLKIFLEEYVLGDGHHFSDKSFVIYTKSKLLAEQLSFIGTVTGYRPYISHRVRTLNNKKFDSYTISFGKYYCKTLEKNQFKKKNYSGIVYDFTTELGNFLVERNGTTFFTGNCGNHDDYSYHFLLNHGIDFVCERFSWKVAGKDVLFIHDPNDVHKKEYDCYKFIVHGHTHEKFFIKPDPRRKTHFINVCVEKTNYKPVLLDSLLSKFHKDKLRRDLKKELKEMTLDFNFNLSKKKRKINPRAPYGTIVD